VRRYRNPRFSFTEPDYIKELLDHAKLTVKKGEKAQSKSDMKTRGEGLTLFRRVKGKSRRCCNTEQAISQDKGRTEILTPKSKLNRIQEKT
jgi:hypothetical protein